MALKNFLRRKKLKKCKKLLRILYPSTYSLYTHTVLRNKKENRHVNIIDRYSSDTFRMSGFC